MSDFTIRRAVVIGSGTMGGGIAAHFANIGIPVYLLDVTQPVVAASFTRLKKHTPPAFFTPDAAELITIGNLGEHESWIAEGDWIIEAIVEDLAPKRELVARIDRLRKQGSIVSSNTSGIPIASIAAGASDDFRAHFLGTHFFNPPRYMKLLEVIPTPETRADVIGFVRDFATERLGKSVVICKDTPNFIANRLASVGGASVVDFALANGYTVEETDAIAGPLLGRPKTAAFRLQDLVGLDVSSAVASNLHALIPHDESRDVLASPHVEALRKSQTEKNRLGDKSGAGFYKKGGKEILSLDFATGEYRARREPEIPSLAQAAQIASLPQRVKFVLAQDDKAGAMARHILFHALGYAAQRVPEISDDLPSIDRAVRWGFSHDLGPFELWDALGVAETAKAMEKHGVPVAPWVWAMLASGATSFYRDGESWDPLAQTYVAMRHDPKSLTLTRDLGDGILGADGDLNDALDELERGDWKALVITPRVADRATLRRIRESAKPIVAAISDRVLGTDVDVVLAASSIVAAAETYIGAVVPGNGACTELVRRVISKEMRQNPSADSVPVLQTMLQTIAMRKVSSSAEEARALGFLDETDTIVMNRDFVLHAAKCVATAAPGRRPASSYYAAGRDALAALRAAIFILQQAGYARDEDAKNSARIANVLCGGALSSAQWVDEQHFLDLEQSL
ncbi:MAG TPA: 3-hydroxyacyl-CoA dehydrogenase NAD-binding domain-containing protein [Thermoanaerobaculia bacterium]|nr:3-hydroxyacyl-CoA dehydrogenase NAD-binding domain-containing protein [Thermoanaerobaculia bacterium]